MLNTVIRNSIKYLLKNGVLSYDDIFRDSSYVRCGLLGGNCQVNCKYFDPDIICKHAHNRFERRYLTVRDLIELMPIVTEGIMEDRDFYVRVLTGKSMYESDSVSYDRQVKKIKHDDKILLENNKRDLKKNVSNVLKKLSK